MTAYGLRVPLLQGLLPLGRAQLPREAVAGLTLAALAVPEALGYARIAGMPVVTGLYTLVVPVVVFALLGSSRHLVVGADSATAAVLAAGLAPLAAVASPRYVQLAGLAALMTGALLLLARLVRLGFLANFLSRTVLLGFLTGVGISVAVGQLPEMLGITGSSGSTPRRLGHIVRELPNAHVATFGVAVAVVVAVPGVKVLWRRVPGALLAIVASIAVSRVAHLPRHGVAVIGSVSGGLPHLTLPTTGVHDAALLLGTVSSMAVVILAQSAATSRAYASRYGESVDDNADIVGLAGANLAAAVTGAFVVNGSPTKTQILDGAGGRSQAAPLVSSAVVVAVLLLLTGSLSALPLAALAAVVFGIGVDLVDVRGLRAIRRVRTDEFLLAILTAGAVVALGVEQGIVLAMLASVVDHLRHSYSPRNSVLVKAANGHWKPVPVAAGQRTVGGLVIYRFGTSLYYANASRLTADVTALLQGPELRWLCLDAAALGDVDYTAAAVLTRGQQLLKTRGVRLVLANVLAPVRSQLDRYGISAALDADAYYDTPGEVLETFQRERGDRHDADGLRGSPT